MQHLKLLTAGESHGPGLTTILEGIPMGLKLKSAWIDEQLARRQVGYGRGDRMKIEKDRVQITGGVRMGVTLGGPISLWIENLDFANWHRSMSPVPIKGARIKEVTRPRPGHADLAGVQKTGTGDVRNILERASARETAARVAAGSVCRVLLAELGVTIFSHVLSIGGVKALPDYGDLDALREMAEGNDLHVADGNAYKRMRRTIKSVWGDGDTLGGVAEVLVCGLPPGLGSYVHWDRRLDGHLGQAMLSIPAVKGVEIGPAFENAHMRGSRIMDEIRLNKKRGSGGESRYRRDTNRAGGMEGGMTNGEVLSVRAAMKPISTLMKPLGSVDIKSGQPVKAIKERSDCTAVTAMGVIMESMAAVILTDTILSEFRNQTVNDLKSSWRSFRRQVSKR